MIHKFALPVNICVYIFFRDLMYVYLFSRVFFFFFPFSLFMSGANLSYRGSLKGHNGWVTSIATSAEAPDLVLSASRDKSLIVWTLTRDGETYGVPHRRLVGYAELMGELW